MDTSGAEVGNMGHLVDQRPGWLCHSEDSMVEVGEDSTKAVPGLCRIQRMEDSPDDILLSSALFDTGNSHEYPLVLEDDDKLEIHPSNLHWSQRPSCLQESSLSPCRGPCRGNCIDLCR